MRAGIGREAKQKSLFLRYALATEIAWAPTTCMQRYRREWFSSELFLFPLSKINLNERILWHINISPVPGDQKHHCCRNSHVPRSICYGGMAHHSSDRTNRRLRNVIGYFPHK